MSTVPPPAAPGEEESVPRLLELARGGSRDAVGRLLEAYRPYLLLVANQSLPAQLGAKVAASDLVQETCVDVHLHFARFVGSTEEEWRAWLRGILRNNVGDAVRMFTAEKRDLSREERLGTGEEAGECGAVARDLSPSGEAAQHEQDLSLERAVGMLPTHYREVLRLRNQEGLAFEEIGQRLGVTAEAARKLWSRAVRQLQGLLERESDG
jgi:RNA polymerase sigma-70 factor (ECF subfamily)